MQQSVNVQPWARLSMMTVNAICCSKSDQSTVGEHADQIHAEYRGSVAGLWHFVSNKRHIHSEAQKNCHCKGHSFPTVDRKFEYNDVH